MNHRYCFEKIWFPITLYNSTSTLCEVVNSIWNSKSPCVGFGEISIFEKEVSTSFVEVVNGQAFGIDDLLKENIQLYPNNVVNIYNRSGKIVFTMKGYDNSFNGFSNKTSSNKKLPVGAYYFTVEFNTPGAKPAKGWIYINY